MEKSSLAFSIELIVVSNVLAISSTIIVLQSKFPARCIPMVCDQLLFYRINSMWIAKSPIERLKFLLSQSNKSVNETGLL